MADLAPGYARNILDEDPQGVLGRPPTACRRSAQGLRPRPLRL